MWAGDVPLRLECHKDLMEDLKSDACASPQQTDHISQLDGAQFPLEWGQPQTNKEECCGKQG